MRPGARAQDVWAKVTVMCLPRFRCGWVPLKDLGIG